MTLKNGPEATASPSDATNFATVVNVSIRSYLCLTSRPLTASSCLSTRLRFGLSSMKPFTCSENELTRSSSMLTA